MSLVRARRIDVKNIYFRSSIQINDNNITSFLIITINTNMNMNHPYCNQNAAASAVIPPPGMMLRTDGNGNHHQLYLADPLVEEAGTGTIEVASKISPKSSTDNENDTISTTSTDEQEQERQRDPAGFELAETIAEGFAVQAENFFLHQETDRLKEENTELKSENAQLCNENKSLKVQLTEASKKRKAADAALVVAKSSSSSTSALGNKKFRTTLQRRKLYAKWSKALTRTCEKHRIINVGRRQYTEEFEIKVKDTGNWTQAEVEALFGDGDSATGATGTGNKIEPMPNNKHTSGIHVWKYTVNSLQDDQVSHFFSKDNTLSEFGSGGYWVELWVTQPFQKSVKFDDGRAYLQSMEAHWNKGQHNLMFKFQMIWYRDEDDVDRERFNTYDSNGELL
jgi:hypothetical protein